MRPGSFNKLRGKVARTANAIVYDHMVRHYDDALTTKQLHEITKLVKAAIKYASDEAEDRLIEEYTK